MAGRGAVAPWHTSRKETTYTAAFGGKKKGRPGPQHTLADTTKAKRWPGLLNLTLCSLVWDLCSSGKVA